MSSPEPAMKPICSYAQNYERVLLWRVLHRVERGFYVDIGAQDPIADSLSQAFYERGWRGVHVEPNAAYADRLRTARPDEDVVQAAIVAHDGRREFFETAKTGLSTADAGSGRAARRRRPRGARSRCAMHHDGHAARSLSRPRNSLAQDRRRWLREGSAVRMDADAASAVGGSR